MRYVIVASLILLLVISGIVVYATSSDEQRCNRMYPQAGSFEIERCIVELSRSSKS